ncbi:MAG: acyl-CoA thioesterase [Coprobacter sp.]|nr:acyl-CoA thioesterase [Coprobacter sp.]
MESITFNHTVPLQIRFNDIDSLGHLNNAVYFAFYDLGKTAYFETVKGESVDWKKADIVIANIHADFFAPVYFKDPVAVQTAVAEIGNKSMKVQQQIIDTRSREIKAACTTIMVGFDVNTFQAKEISDEWRLAIGRYEGRNLSRPTPPKK